jgi:hypothetical protein
MLLIPRVCHPNKSRLRAQKISDGYFSELRWREDQNPTMRSDGFPPFAQKRAKDGAPASCVLPKKAGPPASENNSRYNDYYWETSVRGESMVSEWQSLFGVINCFLVPRRYLSAIARELNIRA